MRRTTPCYELSTLLLINQACEENARYFYFHRVFFRIQETYDIEFNIDEVIRELNKVQDKIERYIKNKNGFEKNEIVTNTKLEPVEGIF